MNSPVGRGNAASWVANYLKEVKNQVELEGYVAEAAADLQVSIDAIYSEIARARKISDRALVIDKERKPVQSASPVQPKMVYPVALLSLLELAVNYENAARQISELLSPEELSDKDPVTDALNIMIEAALNNEFEQGIKDISAKLTEQPVPEISKILVERATCPDVARAVSDCVADFRRRRNQNSKKELLEKLRTAQTAEEKSKIFKMLATAK